MTVRALWDTGTAETRLLHSLVGNAPTKDFIPGELYTYKSDTGRRVLARHVEIAGHQFDDVPILAAETGFSRDIEMILGRDLIGQLDWYFDPTSRMWSAQRPATR